MLAYPTVGGADPGRLGGRACGAVPPQATTARTATTATRARTDLRLTRPPPASHPLTRPCYGLGTGRPVRKYPPLFAAGCGWRRRSRRTQMWMIGAPAGSLAAAAGVIGLEERP